MTDGPPEPVVLEAGLTVSLVTYHSPLDELRRTLHCLRTALQRLGSARTGWRLELHVWDNSVCPSYHEDLRRVLETAFPAADIAVQLTAATVNAGFGTGHNRSLAGLRTSLLLLLNPDAELSVDALLHGSNYLEQQPQVVLLGPNGSDSVGQPLYLCKSYPSVWVLALRAAVPQSLRRCFDDQLARYERRDLAAATQPTPVTMVSGACMLLRSAAWRAVGGFDSGYFLYFEDFDLSLRLAHHGQVEYHPALMVCHHGGYAARKGWRHRWLFVRSAGRFFRQHGWRWF